MGYVIKKTSTATNEHPTRKGEVHEYIIIKGGYVRNVTDFLFLDDKYKTKSIATRVMNSYIKKERPDICWNNKYEVMEV